MECKIFRRQHLLVFESKIFRIIYGPIREEEQWRIRHNHELPQLYKHPDVVQKLRAKRLAREGHVQRMEPNLPAKKVFCSNPDGDRRPGRPRTRSENLVQAYV